ncbi:hypothetical protein EV651_1099 [Kribbella sp. VKM Ac-2571]|nr:hypothetical protein EV651_1099 [Kribbella sp. VKM Ac-2571]
MPLIDNPRAMASTGLLLGGAAFWVLRSGVHPARLGRAEGVVAAVALVLYVFTIAFAATATAELLLAAFICSLMVVFTFDVIVRGRPRRHAEGRR